MTSDSNYVGSINNPWTVYVDTERPERNLIFDIVYVKRIEHGGWAREVIDIRVEVGAMDRNYWSAWIESLDDYCGTSVMIRGCSRSSVFDEVTAYHDKKDNADLMAAQQKTKDELKNVRG